MRECLLPCSCSRWRQQAEKMNSHMVKCSRLSGAAPKAFISMTDVNVASLSVRALPCLNSHCIGFRCGFASSMSQHQLATCDHGIENGAESCVISCRASFPDLAAELLSEVWQCTKFRESKAYLTGILKVLQALPLNSEPPAAIKRLRALAGKTSRLFCLGWCRTAAWACASYVSSSTHLLTHTHSLTESSSLIHSLTLTYSPTH